MNKQSKQTTIYIGLNDSETGVQKFDSEKYLSILKNACKNYNVAFSVQEISGGYFHEDGRYTEENTLMLMLIDAPAGYTLNIGLQYQLCAQIQNIKK
jgi:hypothetical protein